MTELKIQHILILSYLLEKGARYNFVTVTTSDIGRHIKKSQQSASKHILEIENSRLIERTIDGRNISIWITAKGYSEMVKLSSILQKSLDSQASIMELKGVLVSGMGEGAYYMSLDGYTRQFRSKIGYVPYPGTLNIKLDKKVHMDAIKQLDNYDGVKIDGFSDSNRTYGWVKCFRCIIDNLIKCELVVLERTHHDDSIIELISSVCIRDACNIKDGSRVSVKIPLDFQL